MLGVNVHFTQPGRRELYNVRKATRRRWLNCSNITCEHSSPTPLANILSLQSTQLFRRVSSSNHGPKCLLLIGPWFKPQADLSLFHLSVSVEYIAASRPRHGPYMYRSCLSMISVDVKHHQCLLLLRYLTQAATEGGCTLV